MAITDPGHHAGGDVRVWAAYMQSLFDYGYQLARDGAQWHRAPPGEGESAK